LGGDSARAEQHSGPGPVPIRPAGESRRDSATRRRRGRDLGIQEAGSRDYLAIAEQYLNGPGEEDYRHATAVLDGTDGITPANGNTSATIFLLQQRHPQANDLGRWAETACGGGTSSVLFSRVGKRLSFIDLRVVKCRRKLWACEVEFPSRIRVGGAQRTALL